MKYLKMKKLNKFEIKLKICNIVQKKTKLKVVRKIKKITNLGEDTQALISMNHLNKIINTYISIF